MKPPVLQSALIAALVASACNNAPAFEMSLYVGVPTQHRVTALDDNTTVTLMYEQPYPIYHITQGFPDYNAATMQGVRLRAVNQLGEETLFVLRPIACEESCDPVTPMCGDRLVLEEAWRGSSDLVNFSLNDYQCHYADGAAEYGGSDDT